MEDRRNLALQKAQKSQKDVLNRLFKAKNPELYNEECYHFCQECKDYFKTTGAKCHKCNLFAAFFFKDRLFFFINSIKIRLNMIRLCPQFKKNLRFFSKKT